MEKVDKNREIRLKKKREKKLFKRRKRKFSGFNSRKKNYTYLSPSLIRLRIQRCYSNSFKHFVKHDYFHEKHICAGTIYSPKVISFKTNFLPTLEFLKQCFSSVFFNSSKDGTVISFANCEKVEIGPILILMVILKDFYSLQNKYNKQFKDSSIRGNIVREKSQSDSVNDVLFALGIITRQSNPKQGKSISTLGFQVGNKKKKHYHENKKGPVCTKIRSYINHCMNGIGLELSPTGCNHMDDLITEILNNAEDHSEIDEWYVTSAYINDDDGNQGRIGELHLAILNLGYSIYEGFEQTRDKNKKIYDLMNDNYIKLSELNSKSVSSVFTKENIFTLYALQEGISRLKFIEESRGNGTMNFINAFMQLGDYEDTSLDRVPSLDILSGKTLIICDNNSKPIEKDGTFYLSLNTENDLSLPPDKNYLTNTPVYFPGTLLEVKMFLSGEHILRKIENERDRKTNGHQSSTL